MSAETARVKLTVRNAGPVFLTYIPGVRVGTLALTYESLLQCLKDGGFQSRPDGTFGVRYVDNENDIVTMSTDEELREAICQSCGMVDDATGMMVHELELIVEPDPSEVPPVVAVSGEESRAVVLGMPESDSESESGSECSSKSGHWQKVNDQNNEVVSCSDAESSVLLSEKEGDIEEVPAPVAVKGGLDESALSPVPSAQVSKELNSPSNSVASLPCAIPVEDSASESGVSNLGSDKETAKDLYHLLRELGFPVAPGFATELNQLRTGNNSMNSSVCAESEVLLPGSPKVSKSEDAVHLDVQCNGCSRLPIVGARFKCTVCYDYDLCEECEASGSHDAAHPMVKHRVPVPYAMENKASTDIAQEEARELRSVSVSSSQATSDDITAAVTAALTNPEVSNVIKGMVQSAMQEHRESRKEKKREKKEANSMRREDKRKEKEIRKEEKLLRKAEKEKKCHHSLASEVAMDACMRAKTALELNALSSQEVAPEVVTSPAPVRNAEGSSSTTFPGAVLHDETAAPAPAPCANPLSPRNAAVPMKNAVVRAKFLRDISYPDGAEVKPGQTFLKVWRIRNDGMVMFPPGTRLVFFSGVDMARKNAFSRVKSIPVDSLYPGEEANVSVELVAPSVTGAHRADWRIVCPDPCKANETLVLQRLWVDVSVVSKWQEELTLLYDTGLNAPIPMVEELLDRFRGDCNVVMNKILAMQSENQTS